MTRPYESDTLGRPDLDRNFADPEVRAAPARRSSRGLPTLSAPGPVAVLAVVLVAALVVTLLVGDVALIVILVLGIAIAAWAPRIGWRVSFATVLSGALVGQVLLAWTAPHVGWSFGTDTLVAWLLVGAGHVVMLALGPLPALGRRRLVDLAAVAAAPLLVGCYVMVGSLRGGPPWIAWGMLNDTANNVILNRQLIVEGGLLKAQNFSAPLSIVLYGSWGAQDAGQLGYADLVRQLIVSGERLGLLIWAAVGVAAAVLALRRTRSAGQAVPGRRVLVGLAVGLLPWTWFGAGYAFAFGFENAGPAVLVLLLAWICWTEQRHHPVAALTGVVLATWAAATAWGPVAALPAALLLGVAVAERRALRASGRLLLVPGLTFVAACVYAYVVTFRDVTVGSGAFSYDGAAPVFSATRTCVVLGLLVLTALALGRRVSARLRLGLLLAVLAGAAAVGTLIHARAGLPEWWGYYPIKFTWIAMTAVVVAAFAGMLPLWSFVADRLWRGTGVVLTSAVALTMLYQMSPPLPTLTTPQLLAPVAMHDDRLLDDPAQRLLFMIGQHPKSLIARLDPALGGGPAVESFMNFWMIEMAARSINDPIRVDAYAVNSADPASLCATIQHWGGGVVVWTSDPALRGDLASACGKNLDYSVRMLPRSTQSTQG